MITIRDSIGIFYQIKKRSYKTTIYQEKITQTISYYLNT
jgi:hypothetical protein